MSEKTSDLRRAVTQQLGEAMFAAVGLFVRQYFGDLTGERSAVEDETASSTPLSAKEFLAEEELFSAVGERSAAPAEQVNESFDMQRFLRLREEASSAARAEIEPLTQKRTSDLHSETRQEAETAPAETAALLLGVARDESAKSISRCFETDARRYDADFVRY